MFLTITWFTDKFFDIHQETFLEHTVDDVNISLTIYSYIGLHGNTRGPHIVKVIDV